MFYKGRQATRMDRMRSRYFQAGGRQIRRLRSSTGRYLPVEALQQEPACDPGETKPDLAPRLKGAPQNASSVAIHEIGANNPRRIRGTRRTEPRQSLAAL